MTNKKPKKTIFNAVDRKKALERIRAELKTLKEEEAELISRIDKQLEEIRDLEESIQINPKEVKQK